MSCPRRQPWPWEGQPDPLPDVRPLDLSRLVVMPDVVESSAPRAGGVTTAGELPGVRESMRTLQGDLVRHGYDPGWVDSKCRAVARQFDDKRRAS